MYKKVRLVMVIVLMISALLLGKTVSRYVSGNQVKNKSTDEKTIVIDAGHGGCDPGKVGINKCEEKDINLQIADKVKKELEKKNIKVIMTRTDDNGLYSEGAANRKAEDMKKRVEIINKSGAVLTVSIHQNSYSSESVKGAQVFYFTHSAEGKKMAEIMQENFRLSNPSNKRMAKGNNTYYMLKKTEIPTIIIECGFLSNWEEAEKLVTEEYQQEMAEIICDGIMNILQQEM